MHSGYHDLSFEFFLAQGNWLSNLFTGLSEAVDDAKVKEKIDTLGTHIKKVSGKIVKNFKTELPNVRIHVIYFFIHFCAFVFHRIVFYLFSLFNRCSPLTLFHTHNLTLLIKGSFSTYSVLVLFQNDWVEVTKQYLKDIKFKDILKEEGDEKMEELVEKWNLILQELNNPEKFENAEAMYKKITKDLKGFLPKELFKQWKKKVHNIAMKIKESVQTQMKDVNVDTLKKQAKAWVQPIFMQHKENIEEEKQMVQGINCY